MPIQAIPSFRKVLALCLLLGISGIAKAQIVIDPNEKKEKVPRYLYLDDKKTEEADTGRILAVVSYIPKFRPWGIPYNLVMPNYNLECEIPLQYAWSFTPGINYYNPDGWKASFKSVLSIRADIKNYFAHFKWDKFNASGMYFGTYYKLRLRCNTAAVRINNVNNAAHSFGGLLGYQYISKGRWVFGQMIGLGLGTNIDPTLGNGPAIDGRFSFTIGRAGL